MSPLEKLPLPFGFLQFPEEAPLFCTQLICKIRKTTRSPRKKGALDDFLQCCGDPSRRLGNGHCLKYEFIIFHYFSSFVSFPCVVLLVLPDSGMACLFAVSLFFFFFFLVCIFFFFFLVQASLLLPHFLARCTLSLFNNTQLPKYPNSCRFKS